jgi:gamma-glutamylcyclotransferase (GGCT)/AIG2-like uncharacterized protein YtfP
MGTTTKRTDTAHPAMFKPPAKTKTTKPTRTTAKPADDDDRAVRLTIKGKTYEIDPRELTLDDLATFESVAGMPYQQIDFESATGTAALAYLLMTRAGEDVTLEDVGRLKTTDFGVPPTKGGADG